MNKAQILRKNPAVAFFYKNTAVLYFLVISIAVTIFLPNFRNPNNIIALIKQSPTPIIRAMAVSFILVLGNVDLSLGYLVGLVSVCMGIMLNAGLHPALVILLSICLATTFGAVNGFAVTCLKAPSFIVTLGTGFVALGISQLLGEGKQYAGLPQGFLIFGRLGIGGFPISILYALIVMTASAWIFNRTIYGRTLISMGLNSQAAYLSGMKTKRALFCTFLIAGALAGFTAILSTIRIDVAQATMGGADYTFEGVTACVLGGTSLSGGKVNIFGTFFATLTILIISNVITILQINRYFYQPVLGVIILLAVLIDCLKKS